MNEAKRLLREGLPALGLPLEPKELAALPKGDSRKVCLAMLLRKHTTATNAWIAQRLSMGEPSSVSRLTGAAKTDSKSLKALKQLEAMLK